MQKIFHIIFKFKILLAMHHFKRQAIKFCYECIQMILIISTSSINFHGNMWVHDCKRIEYLIKFVIAWFLFILLILKLTRWTAMVSSSYTAA